MPYILFLYKVFDISAINKKSQVLNTHKHHIPHSRVQVLHEQHKRPPPLSRLIRQPQFLSLTQSTFYQYTQIHQHGRT
jgi:hypothetical protein